MVCKRVMRVVMAVLCLGVVLGGCKKAASRRPEAPARKQPVIDPSRPRAGATPVAAPDAGLAAVAADAGLSPQAAQAAALAQAKTAGILGTLSLQNGSAFKSLTGTGNFSAGFDDLDIKVGLLGNSVDDLKSRFGLGGSGYGLGGGGTGGGGTGWGTIGTGRYGTIGTGSGTGSGYGVGSGYGSGRGSGRGVGGLGRSPSPSPAPKKPVPPARTSPPAPAMP